MAESAQIESGKGLWRAPRIAAVLALACAGASMAQPATAPSGGIYSCTDSRGRTITADRPIADCRDREQRELSPSGGTLRRVEPAYSPREQAEREDRERQQQIVQQRAVEERRRERALLVRYPNPSSHERERKEALDQIDVVTQAARKRLSELDDERRKIDDELEFYARDPSKAPDSLRRKMADNKQSALVQNRFIGDQEDEKKRVNARFDEERARLRPLWGPASSSAVPAAMR